MNFDRDKMRAEVSALAARGVYLGTSSWKYEGWLGQIYSRDRYEYRGKFARSRFQRNCLAEYAEVFKTVCVDAAYYTFPNEEHLQGLAAQVPDDFLFGFKVTDEITVKGFPNLARFGRRAGKPNENFLNADLFGRAFLRPLESIRSHVGLLIFEFSRFYPGDYQRGADFLVDLDRFLGALPTGWPYGVEVRNERWLRPEYFECLSRHQVAHIFNSWDAMPPVREQMALAESRTHPGLVGARFLLKPGRKYAQAVKSFEPYARVQDVNPQARAAGRQLIKEGVSAGPRRKTFVYVNNRMEGSALGTIAALLGEE